MEQSTRQLQPAATNPLAASLAPASSAGSALYVINLCASMAPIKADKTIPGFENYRVYQVSRKEDGRIRYRLRLGFFTDEAEAETALACIREHYPTAFATSLCDEDQRHTRGFAKAAGDTSNSGVQPKVVASHTASQVAAPLNSASLAAATIGAAKPASMKAPQTAVQTPQAKVAPQVAKPVVAPAAKAPAAPPATASAASPLNQPSASDTQRVPAIKVKPAAEEAEIEIEWTPAPVKQAAAPVAIGPAAPTSAPTTELTLASEPAAPAHSAPAKPNPHEPFHVGKGVDIPASELSLEAEVVAPVAPTTQPAQPQSTPRVSAAPARAENTPAVPIERTAKPRSAQSSANKPLDLPKPSALRNDAPLPDFDSTQTIRALTAAELDDETQPKWYAIQLAVSEQPINLETMPHLDIFSAYRLYSVATAGSGKILHHMRIGFFKEEVSAEAVCGYLKTFFANPSVLRISVAEYTRFSEAPPPKNVPEPKAKIIDIAAARGRTPAAEIPVVTMEVTPSPSATGQFAKLNTANSGLHKRLPEKAPPAKVSHAARNAAKSKTSASGKHRSLEEALLAEAREVELSESAIRRLPKNSSLLAKLFGKK